MDSEGHVDDSAKDSGTKATKAGRLKTGLIVVGSVFLGGIAVALWDRRTLARMRNQTKEDVKPLIPSDDDAIY